MQTNSELSLRAGVAEVVGSGGELSANYFLTR